MAPRLAIIGGTGVYDPNMLTDLREEVVSNEYGEALVRIGKYEGLEVVFLQRHGKGHTVPPHLVNYRANIWALKQLGVERIVATTAVGSVREHMGPGHFVICDQFLDFTKSRKHTFFEGGPNGVVHTDMTNPYSPEIRKVLVETGRELGLPIHDGGCYACFEGPRFETPAEIKMTQILGGDLVGMTNVPEVVLAREAQMGYAVISMVTNYAAGISKEDLTHEEVLEVMAQNGENLKKLIMLALPRIAALPHVTCGRKPDGMPG
jgi:5'-methylthioadenosine phosphorylase